MLPFVFVKALEHVRFSANTGAELHSGNFAETIIMVPESVICIPAKVFVVEGLVECAWLYAFVDVRAFHIGSPIPAIFRCL